MYVTQNGSCLIVFNDFLVNPRVNNYSQNAPVELSFPPSNMCRYIIYNQLQWANSFSWRVPRWLQHVLGLTSWCPAKYGAQRSGTIVHYFLLIKLFSFSMFDMEISPVANMSTIVIFWVLDLQWHVCPWPLRHISIYFASPNLICFHLMRMEFGNCAAVGGWRLQNLEIIVVWWAISKGQHQVKLNKFIIVGRITMRKLHGHTNN